MAQAASLYIIIYTNNKYMDDIRLSYLYLTLKNKINYKYSTGFLRLGNIYTYNFESITRVTK